jgi:hypothetical protein
MVIESFLDSIIRAVAEVVPVGMMLERRTSTPSRVPSGNLRE